MVNGLLDVIIAVPAFLVVLTLVVFVHEFGHFQVGRWFKIAIKSFSIGMGPPLVQRTDKHGTVWKVSQIPIGGFVSWQGDEDVSSTAPVAMPSDPAERAEARAKGLYHAQSPGVRASVALAGPMANFIFSIVAFAALVMIGGQVITKREDLPSRVDAVAEKSAAQAAGIRAGDMIVAVDGRPIATIGQLLGAVSDKAGVAITVSVRRGDATIDLTAVPQKTTDIDQAGIETTRGVLGVSTEARPEEIKVVHPGPVAALGHGVGETWRIISSTGAYIGNIFTGKASAGHLAGPLGIMNVSGQVAKATAHGDGPLETLANLCAGLVSLAAFLSVAIGIANLLPIPVLDGGHILLCAIEAVRGKPLGEKAQDIGFKAGLAMLVSLFLLATWNDLQRLNVLEFLRGILS